MGRSRSRGIRFSDIARMVLTSMGLLWALDNSLLAQIPNTESPPSFDHGILTVSRDRGTVTMIRGDGHVWWQRHLEGVVDACLTWDGVLVAAYQDRTLSLERPGETPVLLKPPLQSEPELLPSGDGILVADRGSGLLFVLDREERELVVREDNLGPYSDILVTKRGRRFLARAERRWIHAWSEDDIRFNYPLGGKPLDLALDRESAWVLTRDPTQIDILSPTSPHAVPLGLQLPDAPWSCVGVRGKWAALGSEDGRVLLIEDRATTWRVIDGLGHLTRVRLVPTELLRYRFSRTWPKPDARDASFRELIVESLERALEDRGLPDLVGSLPEARPLTLPQCEAWIARPETFAESVDAWASDFLPEEASDFELFSGAYKALGGPPSHRALQAEIEGRDAWQAIASLYRAFGPELEQEDAALIAEVFSILPPSWNRVLGASFHQLELAYREVHGALADLSPSTQRRLAQLDAQTLERVHGRIRRDLWDRAAARLVLVSELITAVSEPLPNFVDVVRIPTPLGDLVLGTHGNDVYREPCAFLFDPGGNDIYGEGLGGASPESPLCLLIDLEGDDQYRSQRPIAQGGALLGVAHLLDQEGDDRYEGTWIAQGAAIMGMGTLIDRGGHDEYTSSFVGQGTGLFGIGQLHDRGEGVDRYSMRGMGQGVGGPLGVGVLGDQGGSDTYTSQRVPLTSSAAHDDWGRYLQGYGGPMPPFQNIAAGGLGLLVDGSGDDAYHAQRSSIGYGRAGGFGLVVDAAGHDRYVLTEKGLGASESRGGALLLERLGDDVYVGGRQALGYAASGGLAFATDRFGDDVYECADSTHGIASGKSLGVFIDFVGNDQYRLTRPHEGGPALGASLSGGEGRGVFIDGAGHDRYPSKAWGNQRVWESGQGGIGTDFP